MPVEPRGLQASRMFRDTFAIFNGGISRVNKTDTLTVKWGDLLEEPYEGKLHVRFCEGSQSDETGTGTRLGCFFIVFSNIKQPVINFRELNIG